MFRRFLWPCAAFLSGWVLLSRPWLTGLVTIPYDAKAHFQAQIQFLAQAWHSGNSPFWTPNVFTGSPQIADPQSLIFSPAALVALLTHDPSFAVVDAYVLALLLVGGLCVLLFGLDRGWRPAAALVTAFAFSFGASAAWRIQHVGQIKSYVFFGITLWLLGRLLRSPSYGYALACGLAAGVMVAEPDQVALLACYALAAFAIHEILSHPDWKNGIKTVAPRLALASAVCVALAFMPLLFTILFAEASNRPQIHLSEALLGSLHPASLLTLGVSDLYGAFSPNIPYWGPSTAGWASDIVLTQNMGQLYLGQIPLLALAIVGLKRGMVLSRGSRFFAGAALVFTLYSLGRYTPGFEWAFHFLPGVEQFRRPADGTFMIGAMIALASGALLNDWLDPAIRVRWVRLFVVLAGIGIAMFVVPGWVADTHGHFAEALPAITTSLLWLLGAVLVLLVSRGLIESQPGRSVTKWALPLILSVFMVGDLSFNNGPNESTAKPPETYDALEPGTKNETVAFLKRFLKQPGSKDRRPRVELAGLGFQWPNAGLVQGFENIFGYNPLRMGDYNAATGSPDTIATPDQRKFTPVFPSYKSVFANLLGLRYIATGIPIELIDPNLKSGDLTFLGRTREAYVYENADALPRVLFAGSARSVDFDQIVATGQWPRGFDPTREVLLENIHEDSPKSDVDEHAGYARIIKYRNTVVEIEVQASRPGYLVLNDAFHPWWRATVDGEETPIMRANLLFRAISVPEGNHKILFEFKPVDGSISELASILFRKDNE